MILKVENLSAEIGRQKILDNVSFSVKENEIYSIIGPSGSGKTTLLKCLAGLLEYSGKIFFNNQLINLPPQKRNIGLVTQDFSLFTHFTVFENIAFPLKIRKQPIELKANEFIKDFGLEKIKNRYPNEISGGEAQRVNLARALIYQPQLLLLDEPFSQLDALLRFDLLSWLKNKLISVKIPVIFVTHDIKEAKFISDKIILLKQGKIAARGFDSAEIQEFLNKSL